MKSLLRYLPVVLTCTLTFSCVEEFETQPAMGAAGSTGEDIDEPITSNTGDVGEVTEANVGGVPMLPEVDPEPEPCGDSPALGCVADPAGTIFVKAGAAGDGSLALPIGSVPEGLAAAQRQGATRLIVCNGVFDERFELTAGTRLEGGYDCIDGAAVYNPAGQTLFAPSEAGFVMRVADVADVVTIRDIAFKALAAQESGESSVAASVVGSEAVYFERVTLLAGDGKAGARGVLEAYSIGSGWTTMIRGVPGAQGGQGAFQRCADGIHSSAGGDGGFDNEPGQRGLLDFAPVEGGGEFGDSGDACDSGGSGSAGISFNQKPEPGPGAAVLGRLTAEGWMPEKGVDGTDGLPGQGGGGGRGGDGTRGGGGGAGGCGGAGGGAGHGGGASIALLVFESSVTLSASTVKTGNAGDGGSGAAGQPMGQPGGVGASGEFGACHGGSGGDGSPGGDAGGGAGGVSVGVLWSGEAAPVVNETSFEIGAAGKSGLGPGGNGGVPGAAAEVLEVE